MIKKLKTHYDNKIKSAQNYVSAQKASSITFYKKYEKYVPAAFFVGGFLFDIVTLSRIDDWFSLLQQLTYLLILLQILKYKTYEQGKIWVAPEKISKWWEYSNEVLHFILGSLLSSYTLFYFVSSSFSTSFIFLLIIFSLLIANELPKFQKQELILKYALYSICVYSFFFIIIPISFGSIGAIPFLIALACGLLMFFALFKTLSLKNLIEVNLKKTILAPAVIVASSLAILYFTKILPPIPLSLQYIGIYHQIEKVKVSDTHGNINYEFQLKYDRNFWKFWQNGAQDFVAIPGDKIFCFIRVFAPINFHDQITYHWYKKYPNGWMSMDQITNEISGGRSDGFRGFAIKSNFEEGNWRVLIETLDKREIGRINFKVTFNKNANAAHTYRIDTY